MIDWDEVNRAENVDELKNVKLWLFQENVRLENERRELALSQEKFVSERVRLREELDELNRKTLLERKRLKEETIFSKRKWRSSRTVLNIWMRIGSPWSARKRICGRKAQRGQADKLWACFRGGGKDFVPWGD